MKTKHEFSNPTFDFKVGFSTFLIKLFYFIRTRNVLQTLDGTAVDAAIATLFCNGLISSHSMGVGGGFLMTIYDKSSKKVTTIDAREAAPAQVSCILFLFKK